jgi:hypothetical protein
LTNEMFGGDEAIGEIEGISYFLEVIGMKEESH